MIICRNKRTNKLEDIYSGVHEYMFSSNYSWNTTHCNIYNKYPEDLTEDEYQLAKKHRIL